MLPQNKLFPVLIQTCFVLFEHFWSSCLLSKDTFIYFKHIFGMFVSSANYHPGHWADGEDWAFLMVLSTNSRTDNRA